MSLRLAGRCDRSSVYQGCTFFPPDSRKQFERDDLTFVIKESSVFQSKLKADIRSSEVITGQDSSSRMPSWQGDTEPIGNTATQPSPFHLGPLCFFPIYIRRQPGRLFQNEKNRTNSAW